MAEEMAQQENAMAAFSEDLSSIPSIQYGSSKQYGRSITPVVRDLILSSGILWYYMHVMHRHTWRLYAHANEIKI